MSSGPNPTGRRDEIVVQEYADEVLIYDLRHSRAYCLNPTSAAVWKLCDGSRSFAEITTRFAAQHGTSGSDDLVWLALDQLKKEGLIDRGFDGGDRFAGISRRQVIKQIGLGSMIALPAIASLVAPQNALASASCGCVSSAGCAKLTTCPSTSNCNGSGQCAP